MEKQGMVYMVPCKDCSHPYIGETKQPLGARVKHHKANTVAEDMLNGPAHQPFHHDHKVHFEGTLILDTEKQLWLSKTKEDLFIWAANPGKELIQVMNQDHGCTALSAHAGAGLSQRSSAGWDGRRERRASDQGIIHEQPVSSLLSLL